MSPRPFPEDDDERARREALSGGTASIVPPTDYSEPPSAPAQKHQDNRALPGTFVNFSRRFSANRGVAQREAQKYAGQAQAAATRAQGGLQGAQAAFARGMNTGTVQAPGGAPSTNVGGAAPPPVKPEAYDPSHDYGIAGYSGTLPPPAAPATPAPTPAPGTKNDELVGESTRPSENGGKSLADLLALAGSKYTGPNGLDDDKAAGAKLSADALAAEQQLNLVSGNGVQGGNSAGLSTLVNASGQGGSAGSDDLSGALIGAAGKHDFDALRARFNPNKELQVARDKAKADADNARIESAKNAGDWAKAAAAKGADEKQLAEYEKARTDAQSQKEEEQKNANDKRVPPQGYQATFQKIPGQNADTPRNRQAYMMTGVDPGDKDAVAKRQKEIDEYTKALQLTTQQQMDQTFNDINSAMSPSVIAQQLAGSKDQTQKYAQDSFNKGGTASQTGSTDDNAIPWNKMGVDGFWVWRSMTPDDWKVLNSKPANGPNGQIAWIQTKGELLRQQQASADKANNSSRTAKA